MITPLRLPEAVPPACVPTPARRAAALTDPQALHPALWHARGALAPRGGVLSSGFAALDAELPGGGWPAGSLTELLLGSPGLGEWRLLAPVLEIGRAHV